MPLDVRSRIAAAAAVLSAWALVNTCENPPPAPRLRPPPTPRWPGSLWFDEPAPVNLAPFVVDPYPFPIRWKEGLPLYDVRRLAREQSWPGDRTKRAVKLAQAFFAGAEWPEPSAPIRPAQVPYWVLPEGISWAEAIGRRCKGKELWIVPVGWVWGCEHDCEDGANWTVHLNAGSGGGLDYIVAVEPAPSLRFEVVGEAFSKGLIKVGRGDCPSLTFETKNGWERTPVAWRWNGTTYTSERPVP